MRNSFFISNIPTLTDAASDAEKELESVQLPENDNDLFFLSRHYVPKNIKMSLAYLNLADAYLDEQIPDTLDDIDPDQLYGVIDTITTTILNAFGQLVNAFSAATYQKFRAFKRSELMVFSGKIGTMNRLSRFDMTRIIDDSVEIPKGMISSYPKSVNQLSLFLNTLKMYDRSKSIMETLKYIDTNISKGITGSQFSSFIRDKQHEITPQIIFTEFSKHLQNYTQTNKDKEQFGKLFHDPDELASTVKKILDMESYLIQVDAVHQNLVESDKYLKSIIDSAKKKSVVDKKTLTDMSGMVRSFAEAFNMYAIAINDLDRTNHNITFLLDNMRKRDII